MTLRTRRMATFYAQLIGMALLMFGAGAVSLSIAQPDVRAVELTRIGGVQ